MITNYYQSQLTIFSPFSYPLIFELNASTVHFVNISEERRLSGDTDATPADSTNQPEAARIGTSQSDAGRAGGSQSEFDRGRAGQSGFGRARSSQSESGDGANIRMSSSG
jgi:hypothetical protein